MPTYVHLLNWTDQGIKNFKDTVDRAAAAEKAFGEIGLTLKELYWTLGAYDIVLVTEGPDDETVTAALFALGAQGNVRTTTLRAFSRDEVAGIIAKVA